MAGLVAGMSCFCAGVLLAGGIVAIHAGTVADTGGP